MNPKQACTMCRMIRVIVFDKEFFLAIKSGLVSQPEKLKVKLCAKCAIEALSRCLADLDNNSVFQLAGKGSRANYFKEVSK